MKRILQRILSGLLAALLLSSLLPAGAGAVPGENPDFRGEEWYDLIETDQVNREPARAWFVPFEDGTTALACAASVLDDRDERESPFYRSLNGTWKFKFAKNPAAREKQVFGPEAADYRENWDTAAWDDIPVPGSIQMQRDGDGNFRYEPPIYINQRYPWCNYEPLDLNSQGENAPLAPTVCNSVGHYKRTFTLPESWQGRNVFVSFQGVESAFYLYIDGRRVGYGEDSYTADEFNITPYLEPNRQEHTIALEVYRWSLGSYLENQDFIRLSGIFRDVFLYSKADVELRDFFIRTDLDENYENAVLTLDADVRSLDPSVSGTYTVSAGLYDAQGSPVWSEPLTFDLEVQSGGETAPERALDTGVRGTGSKEVVRPLLWFADTPSLYRLLIELRDSRGQVLETACQPVGFREISVARINEQGQQQMQINGKKLMLRGTNRHETDPYLGRAITRAEIRQDLMLMKQFNVNAIRTSHYPNHPYTYALADELGIYICDEANIESHMGATQGDIPAGNGRWMNSVMNRTVSMVERDKNHPSVVIWSLGNEAVYKTGSHPLREDYCFFRSSQWILSRDPGRIRKCERDNRHAPGSRETSMVDLFSTQYWDVGSVRAYAAAGSNDLPYIQSEYAHAMGNALGNFKEYWDVFRAYPNSQGGFIWDWIDQSAATRRDTGSPEGGYVEEANGERIPIYGQIVPGDLERDPADLALQGHLAVPCRRAESQGLTLAAWIRCPEIPEKKHQNIISKGDGGYTLKIDGGSHDGMLEFFVDGWSRGTLVAEFPREKLNQWVYLAATYDGTTYRMYLDGVELASAEIPGQAPFDTQNVPIGIGDGPPGLTEGREFLGEISSVMILNRALPGEALQGSYAPREQELVYALGFEEENVKPQGEPGTEEDFFMGYGGDWGETQTDRDFCCNGIVNADRTPSPELYEVRKVHQEVNFYDDGNALSGEIRVVNEFTNTPLTDYLVAWKLMEDVTVLQKGVLSPEEGNVGPMSTGTLHLPLKEFVSREGYDYYIELEVLLREDRPWAGNGFGKKGDPVASEQLFLDPANRQLRPVIQMEGREALALREEADSLRLTGGEGSETFSVRVSKTTGYLTEYLRNGKPLLRKGPEPILWRARVSNDPYYKDSLADASAHFVPQSVTGEQIDAHTVRIRAEGTITSLDAPMVLDHIVRADGSVQVILTLTPGTRCGALARVGMRMFLPGEYEQVTYYGRGPQENYVDRKTGAMLGVYETTVTELLEKGYVRPQSNGSRSDVRWIALTDREGRGLLAVGDTPLFAGALHCTEEELHRVWSQYGHPGELNLMEDVALTLDVAQRGLGNGSCGPGPLTKYLVPGEKTYTQSFFLRPVEPREGQPLARTCMEASKPGLPEQAAEAFRTRVSTLVTTTGAELEEIRLLLQAWESYPPEVQNSLLEERDYLRLQEAYALRLRTEEKFRAIVKDQGPHGFHADLTAQQETAHIYAENRSPYLTGRLPVDHPGAAELFRDTFSQGSFTIETEVRAGWDKPEAGPYNMICGNGDHSAALRFSRDGVYFFVYTTEGAWKTVEDQSLTAHGPGEWLRIAAVYDERDGGTLILRVNGEETARQERVGSVKPSDFPFGIGYCPETDRGSTGDFRSVHVYGGALTDQELSAPEAEKLSREDLVLWYDFTALTYEDTRSGAEKVMAAIDAIGQVTPEKEEAIAAARRAYEALPTSQKRLVENLEVLLRAEARLEELKSQAALEEAREEAFRQLDGVSCTNSHAALVEEVLARGRRELAEAETISEVEGILLKILQEAEAVAFCPSEPFRDVDPNQWYHSSVDYMLNRNYMKGLDARSFGTEHTVTRAQLVTILYRIQGEPPVETDSNPFRDVGEGLWYTAPIVWAAREGIVHGTAPDRFSPDRPITREQIVAILFRWAGGEQVQEDHLAAYRDRGQLSAYAEDPMNWAVAGGIITGTSGDTISPRGLARRCQICAMLTRYLTKTAP